MAFRPANGTVDFEVKDGIAYLTLNRPRALNAINGRMQQDLEEAWPEVNHGEDVRVLIISGKGEAFCAGDDFKDTSEPAATGGTGAANALEDWMGAYGHKEFPGLSEYGYGPVTEHAGFHRFGLPDRTRGRPAKPVIVAVHGVCSGLGLDFINESDIPICSDDAQFFDPSVNLGEAPVEEVLNLIRLRTTSRPVGLRLALMGKRFILDAQRAYVAGMVTEVTKRSELMDRAVQIARIVRDASPAATRGTVAAYWNTVSLPYKEARFFAQIYGQQARLMDSKEGIAAYLDGRKPEWPSVKTWLPPWKPFVLAVEQPANAPAAPAPKAKRKGAKGD